jgi:hypothetical protein
MNGDVLFSGDPYADPGSQQPPPPEPETQPSAETASGAPSPGSGKMPKFKGSAVKTSSVPSVGGDALKFITMIFVLIVLYDVVTHGTAWSGVFANISSHLANFVSVKPLATVQTTTAAWSNVL